MKYFDTNALIKDLEKVNFTHIQGEELIKTMQAVADVHYLGLATSIEVEKLRNDLTFEIKKTRSDLANQIEKCSGELENKFLKWSIVQTGAIVAILEAIKYFGH